MDKLINKESIEFYLDIQHPKHVNIATRMKVFQVHSLYFGTVNTIKFLLQ